MIDYKKAEQAERLLDESGVDYVLAYVNKGGGAAGQVQGDVLKVADCIATVIRQWASRFVTSMVINRLLQWCTT